MRCKQVASLIRCCCCASPASSSARRRRGALIDRLTLGDAPPARLHECARPRGTAGTTLACTHHSLMPSWRMRVCCATSSAPPRRDDCRSQLSLGTARRAQPRKPPATRGHVAGTPAWMRLSPMARVALCVSAVVALVLAAQTILPPAAAQGTSCAALPPDYKPHVSQFSVVAEYPHDVVFTQGAAPPSGRDTPAPLTPATHLGLQRRTARYRSVCVPAPCMHGCMVGSRSRRASAAASSAARGAPASG